MKKRIIKYLILFILSLGSLVFFNNNHFLYKKDIVKIQKLETIEKSSSFNNLGLEEKYSVQKITAIYLNNKNKGKIITIENEITTSSVVSETYRINDELIMKNNNIENLKRDKYIALMSVIFVLVITIVGDIKGILTISTVVLNSIIFYLGLKLLNNYDNLILLCFIETLIFTITTLIITNGLKRKTYAGILSVIASVLVLSLITTIIILITKYEGVSFTGMEFLTIPPEQAFIASIILGGLGAIMDVCITISSTFAELIEKDKNISKKALIKSGREIGKDIMGTMINVIFFTYLSSGLPTFVLAIRNGYSVSNYLQTNYTLEITRFLIGALGIVIAIPISIYICEKVLLRGEVNE
ncbi:MAG: YibE/F family protein [Bacilli bacterium]|nr:YibE/F family protein [Bacilli bacterium]